MTLSDALKNLYERYGYYSEKTIDIYMEGLDGIEKRLKTMKTLRENPPKEIGGVSVEKIGDYLSCTVTDLTSGEISSTDQPSSDVLYYTLATGDKVIVRPSGTEPKIKIYILLHGEEEALVEKKGEVYEASARKLMQI